MSKLVPVLAIFAGLIMFAIVVPGAADTLDVALDFDDFVEVRAFVTRTSTENHQRGPATGHVEYEFTTPNHETVTGDNSLTRVGDSPELIDELVEREKGVERITVYYDPSDPRRSVIRKVSVWQPVGFIALTVFLFGGGIQAWMTDRGRRKLQARADAARRR